MGEKMNQEEFAKRYTAIFEKTMLMSETARREGLLAIEELIDNAEFLQGDVFALGITLVVDGTDASMIDKILTNIINLEQDNDIKTLKTVQKEAVLSIQAGDNPRILVLRLNSLVNIGIEDAMKRVIR
jgi:flagellar motor component MotA